MTAYRLYALPTTPAALDGMGPQRFSRVTPEYSLVYTDKEQPKGSVEMKEEDATRLSAADENWLLSLRQFTPKLTPICSECVDL